MSIKKLGARYRFEPLDKSHDRKAFHCGNDALDSYFKKQASQDLRKMLSTVFVMVENETESVHGFYTLSAAQIRLDDIPAKDSKKLAKYKNQPAIKLGRLAVHKDAQGQKLGTALLYDAMRRINKQREIGWITLVVDAKDENTRNFYLYHDFESFDDDPFHLYLMHSTIKKMFG